MCINICMKELKQKKNCCYNIGCNVVLIFYVLTVSLPILEVVDKNCVARSHSNSV